MTALLSVIIPTYNRWPMVADAIESVLRQGADVETIVVDDGSTDGTPDLVAGAYPGVRVIGTPNRERGAARNTGLAAAAGDFVAFLDADDCLDDGHVAAFRTALTDDPAGLTKVWSAGADYWLPATGERTPFPPAPRLSGGDLFAACLLGTALPLQGLFVPRESALAVGGFPEDRAVARGEDWVFLLRLVSVLDVVQLSGTRVRVRDHPGRSMADPDAVISARWAATTHLLAQGLPSGPLRNGERRLVLAGSYRFVAGQHYAAGRQRLAREQLLHALRILGVRDGVAFCGRLYLQTWIGPERLGRIRATAHDARTRLREA
jgi:hypothetical protein